MRDEPMFVIGETDGKKYYKYFVDYSHEGRKWSIHLWAISQEDAEQRRRALQYGEIGGPIYAEIPAGPGAGLLVRAICWWKNRVAKRA